MLVLFETAAGFALFKHTGKDLKESEVSFMERNGRFPASTSLFWRIRLPYNGY